MVHGTVRGLFSILGAVAMLAVVAVVWLSWSLSRGPVSLHFLDNSIEQAFSQPNGLAVTLDNSFLEWDRANESLDLRVENFALKRVGQDIARFPELSMTLSGSALLRGAILPATVRLVGPRLRLQRTANGDLSFGLADAGGTGVTLTGDQLLALLQPQAGAVSSTPLINALGSLQGIAISNADLEIDDQKLATTWHAAKVDIALRRVADGLAATADATLDLAGGEAQLKATGGIDAASHQASLDLAWSGLRPDDLSVLGPALQPLHAVQLVTSGSLDLGIALDGTLQNVRFDVDGGAGTLDATPWLGQAWSVRSVKVSGSAGTGFDSLEIDQARIDFGGPILAFKGQVSALNAAPLLSVQGSLDGAPIDDAKAIWPASFLPAPRNWVTSHMSRGVLQHGEWDLAGHLPAGDLDPNDILVDHLAGTLVVNGTEVDFLPPMPPMRAVNATATFDRDSMTILVAGGSDNGVTVNSGKIVLGGLAEPRQTADLSVTCAGSAGDVLRLADSKPLNLAAQMGIKPSAVSGNTVLTLSMQFPLLDNLRLEELHWSVAASFHQLAMPKAVAGYDLSEGEMSAQIDDKGLNATGTAALNGVPATFTWHQDFARAAPVHDRYQVTAMLDDSARTALGLSGAPFQSPWLSGTVPTTIDAALQANGDGTVGVAADLSRSALALQPLGWSKPPGVAATLKTELAITGGQLTGLRQISFTAADHSEFDGSGALAHGRLTSLEIDHAHFGRTDVRGVISFHAQDDGMDVDLTGPTFDASTLLGGDPKSGKGGITDDASSNQAGPPLRIKAGFDSLILAGGQNLANVSADLARDGSEWNHAEIKASLASGKSLMISLTRGATSDRHLLVTSDDGGGTLQAFGLVSNVVGGALKIDADYEDSKPTHPLAGTLTVNDYRVVRAPLLAHLLNVAALTGVVDVLTGQGISFSTMEVPFTLEDGLLDLQDAHAGGPSLGITAEGQIDTDHNRIAIQGTIVPFYLINSLFQNIPLIGPLLSPGSNGGLIALNYSMKGALDDPDTTVNPLTVLTPGFLRNLFNIFGSDADLKARPDSPSPPASSPAPAPGGSPSPGSSP